MDATTHTSIHTTPKHSTLLVTQNVQTKTVGKRFFEQI